jgi:poly-gamma-glutamate synthesis protein (capsule biosynthesis protein)
MNKDFYINSIHAVFTLVVVLFLVYQIYSLYLISSSRVTHINTFPTEPITEQWCDNTKSSTTKTSVLFLGDILLARNVEYLTYLHGIDYSTKRIAGNLPDAQFVIANFESSVAIPHRRTRAYTTQFSTPEWMLPVLTHLQITHASLANNHSLDFGNVGYHNAQRLLTEAGIVPFGHQREISTTSLAYIGDEVTIGIIAINSVFFEPMRSELQALLEILSQTTDVQIAYIHWGDEYVAVHNALQRDLAEYLVSLGVDTIVGHHPHVVQGIQIYNGVPIFYSLGNFIFDQYFSTEVQEGYALLLEIDTQLTLTFTIVPITSTDVRSQPRIMNSEEKRNFLHRLAERSDEQLKSMIVNSVLQFPLNLAELRENGMIVP